MKISPGVIGSRSLICSHHETVHLVGAVLAPMMFDVLKEQRVFDVDAYKDLLKKYKSRKPEKIWDLLGSKTV